MNCFLASSPVSTGSPVMSVLYPLLKAFLALKAETPQTAFSILKFQTSVLRGLQEDRHCALTDAPSLNFPPVSTNMRSRISLRTWYKATKVSENLYICLLHSWILQILMCVLNVHMNNPTGEIVCLKLRKWPSLRWL